MGISSLCLKKSEPIVGSVLCPMPPHTASVVGHGVTVATIPAATQYRSGSPSRLHCCYLPKGTRPRSYHVSGHSFVERMNDLTVFALRRSSSHDTQMARQALPHDQKVGMRTAENAHAQRHPIFMECFEISVPDP